MNDNGHKRVLYNIASPYGLAIISYAFFLFACLLPPSIYTRIMHEPDLMFLDPATMLFYTLCVSAFLAGVWSFEKLFPPAPVVARRLEVSFNPAVFLLIPLLICVVLSALSSVLLIKNNPLLIPLLLSQQSEQLITDDGSGIQLQGTLNIVVLFLNGVIWWAAWRCRQSGIQGAGSWMVKFVLSLAVLAVFISSTLNLVRHSFIVAIAGLAVVYLLPRVFARQLSWKLIRKTAFALSVVGVFFFLLVDWLRGGSGGGSQVYPFVGYTVASYNRMAALLQGKLHFEYPGRGIYFSSFLSFNHSINSIIPFAKLMNIPDFFDWWRASFASVGSAGLDTRLIFCGAFGEVFMELGWFAPFYIFGYGLLYGLAWRWMRDGRVAGILLYPYFAYCILFWFSTNGLFDQDFVALVIDAMILSAYEYLFMSQSKLLVPASQAG
jgi:hypothetical protein